MTASIHTFFGALCADGGESAFEGGNTWRVKIEITQLGITYDVV